MAIQAFVKGNDEVINATIKSELLRFDFNIPTVSVAPSVGDVYTTGGYTLVLTSISGTTYRFISDGNTAVSSSGSLTRVSGIGDSTLTYDSYSSTYDYDLTNATVYVRIIKEIISDSGTSNDILSKREMTIVEATGGKVFYEIPNSVSNTFPVGYGYLAIEVVRDGKILESPEAQKIQIKENKII